MLGNTPPSWDTSSESPDSDSDVEVVDRGRKMSQRYNKKHLGELHQLLPLLPSFDDDSFQEYFQIKREVVYMFIDRFRHKDRFRRYHENDDMPVEKTFLIALSYLINKETFTQVSYRFNCSLSVAQRCLMRTLNFLIGLKADYIVWPNTCDRTHSIASMIESEYHLKQCIGAIGTSHVRITSPRKQRKSYCNNRAFHSLILQGVCQHEMLFTDVYCVEPGGLKAVQVLKRCKLYSNAQRMHVFSHVPSACYYIVGGTEYQHLQWLVTPYRSMENETLDKYHKMFNDKHASTLSVIKKAFALLRARFGRLGHIQNQNVDICSKIIMACCILHNGCITHGDDTNINYLTFIDNSVNTLDEAADEESEEPVDYRKADMRNYAFEEMFPEKDVCWYFKRMGSALWLDPNLIETYHLTVLIYLFRFNVCTLLRGVQRF